MNRKTVRRRVAAALLGAGLAGAWIGLRGAEVADAPAPQPATRRAPEEEAAPERAPEQSPSRRMPVAEAPVLPAPSPPTASGKQPARARPLEVLLHAVDGTGASVAGATVEVWEGQDDQSASVARLATDASGRCTLLLTQELPRVMVTRPGVGTTGELSLLHERRPADRSEWFVTLRPPVQLRGVVLRRDGSRAAAATVFVRRESPRYGEDRSPAPRAAGTDGRFELDLPARAKYSVRATEGDQETHEVPVAAWYSGTQELTLRLRGGLSIGGFLLDPTGQPVAGSVTVRKKPALHKKGAFPVEELFHETKTPALDGSFAIDLPGAALYQVVGSAMPFAHSETTEVLVTADRPRADLVVRLLAPAVIGGRVVRANGEPVARAGLTADAEQAEPDAILHGYSPRLDRFGSVASVISAADGTFRFAGVHPGTTWRLSCTAVAEGGRLSARKDGVRPGEQVTFVLDRDELAGCRIAGVVMSETGAPVTDFELDVVTFEGVTAWRSHGRVRDAQGRFTVKKLDRGRSYSLLVSVKGRAPVLAGPWITDQDERQVTLRLPVVGSIVVRALDAHGLPAGSAEIGLFSIPMVPLGPAAATRRTNEEGRAKFTGLSPGKYQVFCSAEEFEQRTRVEVDVVSGQEAEVELRLPRRQ